MMPKELIEENEQEPSERMAKWVNSDETKIESQKHGIQTNYEWAIASSEIRAYLTYIHESW